MRRCYLAFFLLVFLGGCTNIKSQFFSDSIDSYYKSFFVIDTYGNERLKFTGTYVEGTKTNAHNLYLRARLEYVKASIKKNRQQDEYRKK